MKKRGIILILLIFLLLVVMMVISVKCNKINETYTVNSDTVVLKTDMSMIGIETAFHRYAKNNDGLIESAMKLDSITSQLKTVTDKILSISEERKNMFSGVDTIQHHTEQKTKTKLIDSLKINVKKGK